MSNINPTPPSFTFGYWRPWKEESNHFDSYLDYNKDVSLAKYQADSVGQYISQASSEQVQAIGELGDKIGMASYEQAQAIEEASFEQTQAIRQASFEQTQAIAEASYEQTQAITKASYEQVQAIGQASHDQVEAIKLASNQQVHATKELTKETKWGFSTLTVQMWEVNRQLDRINKKLDILIEQQKITNLLLENISELLRVPDSEKERQHCIELGLKFFVNAQKDDDLFADALEELMEAEKLMKQDYFVLHRIGLIYMFSVKHINPQTALDYFSRAAKYASIESDPKAVRLANALAQIGDRINTKIVTDTNVIGSLTADSYEKAAFAAYVLGDFELAVTHQSKAVKFNDSAENYFFLAKYQTRTKQIELCVQNLEKAIDQKPVMFYAVFKDLDLVNESEVLKLISEKNDAIGRLINQLKIDWENVESDLAKVIIIKLKESLEVTYDIKVEICHTINCLIESARRNWEVENLDVNYFRNGDKIPEAKTDAEWILAGNEGKPAWCYYDNNISHGKKYGKLYNAYAVNDPRGLAPHGFIIGLIDDWNQLTGFFGGKDVAGMKFKSSFGWDASEWKENVNGTNDSGFAILPGGCRCIDGSFHNIGALASVWSSSEDTTDTNWYFNLMNLSDEFMVQKSSKILGHSVRCFSANLISAYANQQEELKNNAIDKEIFSYINELETVQSDNTKALILKFKEVLKSTYNNKVDLLNSAYERNGRNLDSENLNVRYFRNGDEIPEVRSFKDWIDAGYLEKPAWCYYDNDPVNGEKYGKLYNWFAVNDPRGLAPEGWYIPNFDQWEKIRNNSIPVNGIENCGILNHEHGFIKSLTYFWSSSAVDTIENKAYSQELRNGSLIDSYSIAQKSEGLSVHCESRKVQNDIIDKEINTIIMELETVQSEGVEALILELRASLNSTYDKKVEIANLVYASNSLNWISQNLNVSTFRNGDEIPQIESFTEWLNAGNKGKPAWCYYNYDPVNGEKYGKLYNWFAVNDPRGLAPEGWCIPSLRQWVSIKKNSIQINGMEQCGTLSHRNGFIERLTYYWSSTGDDSIEGSADTQEFYNGTIVKHNTASNKSNGLYIRCVRTQFINLISNR